jgi:hypothetical protein
MFTENDLRDALHATAARHRSLAVETIVRRGHRRRIATRSAAGAGAAGVVAVVGVTGFALSGGHAPAPATGQPTVEPVPEDTATASTAANNHGLPIATGTFAPLPAASLLPRAARTRLPPQSTGVPAGTPRTVTDIPFGSGTVAYSLRPEPVFGNADGVLLDLTGADGSLTIKIDGGLSAHATEAHWWYGTNPEHPAGWLVYGVVPAGATQVKLFVADNPVPVAVSAVPGATSLAFTVLGEQPGPTLEGPVTKLTYVDGRGRTVTALAAGSTTLG